MKIYRIIILFSSVVSIFIAEDLTLNGKSTHLNAPVKSSKIITGFSFDASYIPSVSLVYPNIKIVQQ